MKLIAGSILAGFGLLVTALGHLLISDLPPGGRYRPDYYLNLNTPIDVIAILFIVGGIGLIAWGIWETRKSGKAK
jgi:hypothetical protein